MGYNRDNNSHGGHCVTDVVRGIVKAQRRVSEAAEESCATSCERSIEDLLSPARENQNRSRHNTIPFMLFCKDSCKPFVGSGIVKSGGGRGDFYNCVESPIFRVKNFVRGSNTCAVVELLKPVRGRRGGAEEGHNHDHRHEHRHDNNDVRGEHEHDRHDGGHMRDRDRDRGCGCGCGGSACNFFPNDSIRRLEATGICITIDLDCYCGISCLDPITIR